jgi:hypothetical protein
MTSMFMRVNSQCAHQVRPPPGAECRPEADRLADVFPTARLTTLAASEGILLNAIDRVHSRARKYGSLVQRHRCQF